MNRLRRQPHRRAAALTLAFAWLLAPLLATVHSEGHGHRYCSEHRAFEEGTQEVGRGGDRDGAGLAALDVAASNTAGADHLRCPVAHPASRDAAPATAARVSVESTEQPRDTLVAAMTCHAPLDVLALAPKLSPPRA